MKVQWGRWDCNLGRSTSRSGHLHNKVMRACVLSHVRLFPIPWTTVHQAALSMGILQARVPEWVAMSSSRGSSPPRDRTALSCTTGRFFTGGGGDANELVSAW